ncbi:DNA polymerase III subunit epsilon [Candidatus Peregrinibacteria bacterium]|nr:MAG: DNA polymerase III subunit epsilon [Candidatus Peregrinibacteria bacterium]
MQNATYAILDTETTGFYAKRGDRIVEIAAIKFTGEDIEGAQSFSYLINPERNIPKAVTRVHGIVDDMVQDAPVFSAIVDEFIDFLQGVDYLFIHNAKFDLAFLGAEFERAGKACNFPTVICSVELSRALYPFESSHNLNAIAKRCQLSIKEGEGRHRALGDVIMTGEAIRIFYHQNPLVFQGTLEQIIGKGYTLPGGV